MIDKPIADALYEKYYKEGVTIRTKQLEDGTFVITDWIHPDGIQKPDETEINVTVTEYETNLDNKEKEKEVSRNVLLDALSKLTNLSQEQVIKSLVDIVNSRNIA